jgi:hypothetical protein
MQNARAKASEVTLALQAPVVQTSVVLSESRLE